MAIWVVSFEGDIQNYVVIFLARNQHFVNRRSAEKSKSSKI